MNLAGPGERDQEQQWEAETAGNLNWASESSRTSNQLHKMPKNRLRLTRRMLQGENWEVCNIFCDLTTRKQTGSKTEAHCVAGTCTGISYIFIYYIV